MSLALTAHLPRIQSSPGQELEKGRAGSRPARSSGLEALQTRWETDSCCTNPRENSMQAHFGGASCAVLALSGFLHTWTQQQQGFLESNERPGQWTGTPKYTENLCAQRLAPYVRPD